jgi:hypothetical protein
MSTTIAAVHGAYGSRQVCAHRILHDRSIIGSIYVNTRFSRLKLFEIENSRRFTSGTSTGTGKSPAGTSLEMQEAARKHREIQNLLLRQGPAQPSQSPPPSISSTAGKEGEIAFLYQLREQQREQKRRQAIINSVLSFLMVLLAAQGAKNGQERRNAQAGRDHAEQELLRVRDDLRKVVESDESLARLACECIDAFGDNSLISDGGALRRGGMFSKWSNQPSHDSQEARVQQVVKALRQGLSSQLASVTLSDEEKERQEMEQLATFASSALSFPDATTPNPAASAVTSLPSSSRSEDASKEVAPRDDSSTAPKKVFMF